MTSKAKKKKVSMEASPEDFSANSFSNLPSGVLGPSDSSLFEEIKNYEIIEPQISFDENISISAGPYPSDSTLVNDSLFKLSESGSEVKRPFQKRSNKRATRDSLFASCLKDSDLDESQEKLHKPFQRKRKNRTLNTFDLDLKDSELDTPLKDSPFKKPFQRKRRNRQKSNLFDSLLKDSQPNTPDENLCKPFQRKSKNIINSNFFDIDLSNDDSINESYAAQNIIARRKIRRTNQNNEVNLFDEDLSSSHSDISLSRQPLSLKNKKVATHMKNDTGLFDDILDTTENESLCEKSSAFKASFNLNYTEKNEENLINKSTDIIHIPAKEHERKIKDKEDERAMEDEGTVEDKDNERTLEDKEDKIIMEDEDNEMTIEDKEDERTIEDEEDEEDERTIEDEEDERTMEDEETREDEEDERTQEDKENDGTNYSEAQFSDQQDPPKVNEIVNCKGNDKDMPTIKSADIRNVLENKDGEEIGNQQDVLEINKNPNDKLRKDQKTNDSKIQECREAETELCSQNEKATECKTDGQMIRKSEDSEEEEDEGMAELIYHEEQLHDSAIDLQHSIKPSAKDVKLRKFQENLEENKAVVELLNQQGICDNGDTSKSDVAEMLHQNGVFPQSKENGHKITSSAVLPHEQVFASKISKNDSGKTETLRGNDSTKSQRADYTMSDSTTVAAAACELIIAEKVDLSLEIERSSSRRSGRRSVKNISDIFKYPSLDFEPSLLQVSDKTVPICSPHASFNDMPTSTPKVLGKISSKQNNNNNKTIPGTKSSLRTHKSRIVNDLTEDNSMQLKKRRVSFKFDCKENDSLKQPTGKSSDKSERSNRTRSYISNASISLESLVYEGQSESGPTDSESVYIDIHPSRGRSTSNSNVESFGNSTSQALRFRDEGGNKKTKVLNGYSLNLENDHRSHKRGKNTTESTPDIPMEPTNQGFDDGSLENDNENITNTLDEESSETFVENISGQEELNTEEEEEERESEENGEEESEAEEEESEENGEEESEGVEGESEENGEEVSEGEEESGGEEDPELEEEQRSEEEQVPGLEEERENNVNGYKQTDQGGFYTNNVPFDQDENINQVFKIPKKIPKRKKVNRSSIFKEKLLEVPSKSELQDILNKIPFSELKKKRKRKCSDQSFSREQLQQYEIEEELLNTQHQKKLHNNKIFSSSNKLKRPKPWVSQKLYDFLISKLKPRYGIRSRVQAEKLVLNLVERVESIKKKKELLREDVEEMKAQLAMLDVVKTHWDFFKFVIQFFDYTTKDIMYPSRPGMGPSAFEFGPTDVHENIL